MDAPGARTPVVLMVTAPLMEPEPPRVPPSTVALELARVPLTSSLPDEIVAVVPFRLPSLTVQVPPPVFSRPYVAATLVEPSISPSPAPARCRLRPEEKLPEKVSFPPSDCRVTRAPPPPLERLADMVLSPEMLRIDGKRLFLEVNAATELATVMPLVSSRRDWSWLPPAPIVRTPPPNADPFEIRSGLSALWLCAMMVPPACVFALESSKTPVPVLLRTLAPVPEREPEISASISAAPSAVLMVRVAAFKLIPVVSVTLWVEAAVPRLKIVGANVTLPGAAHCTVPFNATVRSALTAANPNEFAYGVTCIANAHVASAR